MNADESKTKLVQDLHFSDEKIAKLEIFVNEGGISFSFT